MIISIIFLTSGSQQGDRDPLKSLQQIIWGHEHTNIVCMFIEKIFILEDYEKIEYPTWGLFY